MAMPAEIVRIAFHKNGRIAQLVRARGTAMYCEGRRSESCSFPDSNETMNTSGQRHKPMAAENRAAFIVL